MGVTGLWSILDSIGHPIKLDALEGKRLGVDANLWLYKFIRGFRDKDNAVNVDSHKLGLFNRISKLLFYKIKPIFVFDGPAPVLKRRTLERRQNLRGKQLEKSQDAAVKLFKEQLKRHYPNVDVNSIDVALPMLNSHLLTAAEKMTDDDGQMFYVPPEAPLLMKEESIDEIDEEDEIEITSIPQQNFKRIKSDVIDVESPDFANLPPEVRYEVLKDVKESRRKIRKAANLPEDSDSFSKLQLSRLMARRSIQEKIEKCEQDICSMYGMDSGSTDQRVEHFRVQSNANANMLFITNNHVNTEQSLSQNAASSSKVSDLESSFNSQSDESPEKSNSDQTKIPTTPRRNRAQTTSQDPTPIHIFKNRTKSTISNESQEPTPIKEPCLSRTPSPEPCTPKKAKKSSPEIITIEPTPEQQAPVKEKNVPIAPFEPEAGLLKVNIPEVITLAETPVNNKSPPPIESVHESGPNSPEVISISSSASSPNLTLPKFNLDSTRWTSEDDSDWTDTEPTTKVITPPRVSLSQPISFKPNESSTQADQSPESSSQSASQPSRTTSRSVATTNNATNFLAQPTRANDKSAEISEPRSASQPTAQPSCVIDNEMRLTYAETQAIINEKNKTHRQTNKVTTKIIEEAKELLRLFGVPYIEATGEAEAQCAILEALGHTEGTVTDDSDIWLFGAQKVYRHFFSDDKYVMEYKMSEIIHHVRMTRETLICLAMLVGSDYTDGVMNVGPVTALEILSEFQGDEMDPLIKFRDWREQYARDMADINASKGGLTKKGKKVGNKKRETFLKFRLPAEFPSRAVFDGYMKPMADTSEDKFTWGLPDLDELREYARRQFDWDRKKTDEKLLPVMKKLSEKKNQLTIDSFFFKTPANENPELFRSKRVNQALSKIAKSGAAAEAEPASRRLAKCSTKGKRGSKTNRGAAAREPAKPIAAGCGNMSEESD